jgi:hypothetical protein
LQSLEQYREVLMAQSGIITSIVRVRSEAGALATPFGTHFRSSAA